MEHPTDEGAMEPPQKGMHTQKLGAQVGTHVNHTHPVRAGAPPSTITQAHAALGKAPQPVPGQHSGPPPRIMGTSSLELKGSAVFMLFLDLRDVCPLVL